MTCWDKLYGKMQTLASDTWDWQANQILEKIAIVPNEVKQKVFTSYMLRC